MTKQSWTLVVIAVALGALYALRFTDLGRAREIQINVIERPFVANPAPGDVLPLVFGLDQDYRLTAVRVTPLTEGSNRMTRPAWTLTSKAGSQPVRGFTYADAIPGMAAPASPLPLLAGGSYRLEVEAGRARGGTNFTAHPALGPGEP